MKNLQVWAEFLSSAQDGQNGASPFEADITIGQPASDFPSVMGQNANQGYQ